MLSAIELTPSGSNYVHIYTQTLHKTTKWNGTHGREPT
jgi:hypothetical protein